MSQANLQFYVNVLFRFCTSAYIIGALFKIMHWPYGSIILISGGILASLFYIFRFALKKPRTFLDGFKLYFILATFLNPESFLPNSLDLNTIHTIETLIGISKLVAIVFIFIKDSSLFFPNIKSNRVLQIVFSLSGFIVILGALFKIMHWPYSGTFLVLGLLLSAVWISISPFLANKPHSKTLHSDTLDAQYTSNNTVEVNTSKKIELNLGEKLLSASAGVFMVLGLVLYFFNLMYSGYIIVLGFLLALIFIFSTARE